MQKYKKGDLVKIAKDLGDCMNHFTADCEAIVIGSYKDQFGGSDIDSYTLHLKGEGECSWYHEHQIELIESGRMDKLKEWEDERDKEIKEKSNLDWIFENGNDVLESPHGASVQALADCFGLTNLWGRNGEGITYYQNSYGTLGLAEKFLKEGDKNGYLEFCKTIRISE